MESNSASFTLLAITVLTPLISFIASAFIPRTRGWLIHVLSPLLMLVSAACAVTVFLQVWHQAPIEMSVTWFSVGGLSFQAGILLNDISALMLTVVCVISFLVHLFSTGYMAGDEGSARYFGMLGFFTFSMLGIVLADNLLLIFVFWELVGFSSYMLIGHWRHKPEAAAAAKKAFVFNRVGDAGFLIGLMIVWATTASFSVNVTEPLASSWNTIAALCVFCGVIGKSAQFPLSTWLPDAMEGPTPVSALIHAATMVAAGVFLLARVFPLFTEEALLIVAVVGIITALVAAMSALVQTDIKKILAYSTISQLGLMVTAIGAGAPDAAMLHLFTHAFFKAGLFLSAGSIIHALHHAQHKAHVHFDVQDIRNLGGLRHKLPFTFIVVVICGAALSGVPFFSGFLSKEAIFNAVSSWKGETFNGKWIVFALAFVVSFMTVLYMVRFMAKIFLAEENTTRGLEIDEPPPVMRAPLALLAVASLWVIVSWNPINPHGWLFGAQEHSAPLTVFSILWIAIALAVAYFMNKRASLQSHVLLHSFYMDTLYRMVVVVPSMAVARMTERFDRRWIDGLIHTVAYVHVTFSHVVGWIDSALVDGAVNGMASLSRMTGSLARSFIAGKIQLYIFWSIFTIIIFLIWTLI